MNIFVVSEAWRRAYPGAAAGILAMHDVANPEHHPELDRRKEELESEIRARFAGQDRAAVAAAGPIPAYNAYFKRFKKTYHVQLQVESVAFKGKSILSASALVEAMFIAELKNMLLTAGHDLDILRLPVTLDVAAGDERYTRLNGQEQETKAGDMLMADGEGIVSTVLYGPGQRTAITSATHNVLFAIYAPPAVGEEPVYRHLRDIEANVRSIAPAARTELLHVYGNG